MATVGLINLCVGTATFAAMSFIGLPNPLLWGTVACVLNFIPYIGPILGAVPGDTARERASVSNAMPGSFAISRPGESGTPQAMVESPRIVPLQRSDSVRVSTTLRHGNIEHDVCHRSISAVAAQIRDYLAALERGHRTVASSPTRDNRP